jgi:acetolactate synthase I/II/III large subunit
MKSKGGTVMGRHGGQVLAEQLKLHGVQRVFSVPGESFLAALDGLYGSGIDNIVCRHEGGAAMMAEAAGKLTGRPGVVFVTRAPGATNASSAIHIARQDSTPLVMFVGQIARGHRDREAFQEMNYRAVFGTMAKWVAEVDETERLPEYINRAFQVAVSGRPGPVVLALPEDMLSAPCDVPALAPGAVPAAAVSDGQIDEILARLAQAKRPLVIAGGAGWSAQAAHDLERFSAAFNLPVAVGFRRQDTMDNRAAAYVGDLGVGMNPRLAERLQRADFLLILGARFGDIATGGYRLVDPAAPGKEIVHVHPDPDLPGSVFRCDLAITARAGDVLARLAGAAPPGNVVWADWTGAARRDYEAWQVPHETPGDVKMEAVVGWLSDNLPEDAIVTNGAGNYAAWLHRYFRFKRYGTQVAPTSGSMGYGFPAAVSAKLQYPEKTVVCMAGDGCFQMTLNEMSTARQHGANVIVIVANNGRYGTIRMHQERHYPGRVSGTDLANPDFAALARAYGGHGEVVERTVDFAGAFARAEAAGVPAVIELRLDGEALSTGKTLSEVRGWAD